MPSPSMPARALAALVALAPLLALAPPPGVAAPGQQSEKWYEQTRDGNKTGYRRVVWAPSTWEGKKTIHDTTTVVSQTQRDMAGTKVARRHRPSDDELIAAITATATHRQAELRPVAEAVRALGELRQRSWERFVERAGLVGRVPEQYQAALDEVAALVDPLLAT